MAEQLRKSGRIGHLHRRPKLALADGNGVSGCMEAEACTSSAPFDGEMDTLPVQPHVVPRHDLDSSASVNEGCGVYLLSQVL